MPIERLRASEARALGFRPSQERYINRETGETFSRRRGQELTNRPLPGGLSMPEIESTPAGRAIVRDFLNAHPDVQRESLLNNQDFRTGYRAIVRLNGHYRSEAQAKQLMRALELIGRVPQQEWFMYLAE